MYELWNLVKEKKKMQNPSCINVLLTNNAYSFQETICTGLSDCLDRNYWELIMHHIYLKLYGKP